jgi:proteasome assembly chaperone (PAC2) family protein
VTCVHTVLTNYSLVLVPGDKLMPCAEVVLLGETPRYAIDPKDRTQITRGSLLTEFRFAGSAAELRNLAEQLEGIADRVEEVGAAFAKATGAKPVTEPGDVPKE